MAGINFDFDKEHDAIEAASQKLATLAEATAPTNTIDEVEAINGPWNGAMTELRDIASDMERKCDQLAELLDGQ